MSRSTRGEKGCGFDFWGRRALSGNCGYGKVCKKKTHAKERAQSREKLVRGNFDDFKSKEAF